MKASANDHVHSDTKLPALTGLRFFAAFAVLLSHFSARGLTPVPGAVTDFLDGGRTAVSLFFVLSGFILAFNYVELSGKAARRRFYVNRIARIYPVLLLSLALGAVGVAYAVLNPNTGYLLSWYALQSSNPWTLAASFVGQITMTTGWLPTARLNQPWNGPAWSIACEMFFYAVFPFAIVWARRQSASMLIGALSIAFASQILFIVAVRALAPAGQRGFLVSQFPLTHLFEFLVGIAVGLFFLRGGKEWVKVGSRRTVLLISSIVPLALLSAFQPVDPAFLPMSPFFAVLIFALAVPPRKRPSLLSARWIVLLGEASFSLYLVHVPLLNLYSIFDPGQVIGWLLAAATVALSVFIYKTFETPARLTVQRALTPAIVIHEADPKVGGQLRC